MKEEIMNLIDWQKEWDETSAEIDKVYAEWVKKPAPPKRDHPSFEEWNTDMQETVRNPSILLVTKRNKLLETKLKMERKSNG